MSAFRRNGSSLAAGTLAGLLAWALGYVLTYVVVAPEIRNSPLNRVVGALGGEPATYEMVGWVYYNAHLVETVVRDVPLVGGGATSFVGGDGFSPVLYLVPLGVLLAAGLALARYRDVTAVDGGAMAGASLLPGYFLASVAGVLLFRVTVGGASGAPDLLAGVVLAGVVYPVLVGGLGGALGAVLEERSQT